MTESKNIIRRMLIRELGEFYGSAQWQDNQEQLRLYRVYDGDGQLWTVPQGLDYTPSRRVTNLIKHLIKEEARFMMGRAPEIHLLPRSGKSKEACERLENFLYEVLEKSGWQRILTAAARDAFIGKRVALKTHFEKGQTPRVSFRPGTEFFYDVNADDTQQVRKVIFAYNLTDETNPERQRIWVQKYEMENSACVCTERLLNGHGQEMRETRRVETGLSFLPAHIIINDGLTGDTLGESDVKELESLQNAYNRMTSDDQDALKFDMFPQYIFTDASQESLSALKVAPHAVIDLQTETTAADRQAKAGVLEAGFNYSERFEKAIERVENDMFRMLSVPKATAEDYKAMGVSGKAMRALYWSLTCRCEEKWAAWDTAIRWMVRSLHEGAKVYGLAKGFEEADYSIRIEHLYPITEDEEEERAQDLREVQGKARSRRSYLAKWQPDANPEEELRQMADEQRLTEEYYGLP